MGVLLGIAYSRPLVAAGGWICTIPTQAYFLSVSLNPVLTLLAPLAALILGFGASKALVTGRLFLIKDRYVLGLGLVPIGCLVASAASGYWTYAHLIGLVTAHALMAMF